MPDLTDETVTFDPRYPAIYQRGYVPDPAAELHEMVLPEPPEGPFHATRERSEALAPPPPPPPAHGAGAQDVDAEPGAPVVPTRRGLNRYQVGLLLYGLLLTLLGVGMPWLGNALIQSDGISSRMLISLSWAVAPQVAQVGTITLVAAGLLAAVLRRVPQGSTLSVRLSRWALAGFWVLALALIAASAAVTFAVVLRLAEGPSAGLSMMVLGPYTAYVLAPALFLAGCALALLLAAIGILHTPAGTPNHHLQATWAVCVVAAVLGAAAVATAQMPGPQALPVPMTLLVLARNAAPAVLQLSLIAVAGLLALQSWRHVRLPVAASD